jgi:hypothetical protein
VELLASGLENLLFAIRNTLVEMKFRIKIPELTGNLKNKRSSPYFALSNHSPGNPDFYLVRQSFYASLK